MSISHNCFTVNFGQEQTKQLLENSAVNLNINIPLLDRGVTLTPCVELNKIKRIYQKSDFHLMETDEQLVGALVKKVSFPLKDAIYNIYREFFQITLGWNICRIWNYVPYINDESSKLENYKSFCQGRSLAFEEFYGQNFEAKLPAGTGVGIEDDVYAIYFVATKHPILNVENPEQVPAFYYPPQYGPRSPSFARGTLTTIKDSRIGYVSGTASIKGHKTVGQGNLVKQFHTTLDNIKLVCEQMGFGNGLPDAKRYDSHFVVYLRHSSDLPKARKMVTEHLALASSVIYLQSNICRSDLDIEIEATIVEKSHR